jgi:hypothetical protein
VHKQTDFAFAQANVTAVATIIVIRKAYFLTFKSRLCRPPRTRVRCGGAPEKLISNAFLPLGEGLQLRYVKNAALTNAFTTFD